LTDHVKGFRIPFSMEVGLSVFEQVIQFIY
jgi:hypothetical protein